MKKRVLIIIILIAVILSAAALFVRHMAIYAHSPVNSSLTRSLKVVVEPGQNFRSITADLQEKGLLKHPLKFRIIAGYQNVTTKIKAGEYRLSGTMSPTRILEHLSKGKVYMHRVTVPEGWNLHEIARKMDKAGLCEKADFIHISTDPDFASKMGIAGHTVEGYLFPETYFFEKSVSVKDIISTMISRFDSVFSDSWKKRAL
ncbi:MAG: endolytic transglycosylase MltG, partial [Desulfobacterales bacterium]|nr:endolytic transglycosylase MltG [Desulfobacterales bacterium]